MKMSFHGANLGVTGSCHMVECGTTKILIDCGLYQGGRALQEENREPLGFTPSEIDYLLLTHAHLDHCGRIPLLVKEGFRGEIITTSASRELAKLVMLDAAGLQEEEANWQNKKNRRRKKKTADIEPLYTTLDALNALDSFGRNANYEEPIKLADGITATFHDAGHILGSASVLLDLAEGKKRKRVLYSGDLGFNDRVVLEDPVPPPDVDIVVMETTYGDRLHKELGPTVTELFEVINDTFKRGGNVIIPTFALERAQELLYHLREGVEDGQLPASMQVFLDSPMAISATEIFRRHPECYDEAALELFRDGKDPFSLPGLHFTRETSESIALNRVSGGAVIMAGSGMCTGGRIRHHLKQNIWRADASIVFVGYAARGTLARYIVDGADTVKIFSEEYPVRAKIHTIGGFSAHADQGQLLRWHEKTGKPEKTILVHGEPDAMEAFAEKLPDTEVLMPGLHHSLEI